MQIDIIGNFLLKHFWQAGLFYVALQFLLFDFLIIISLWLIVEFVYRKSKLKDSKQIKLSSSFVLKVILLTQIIPLIVCFLFMAIKIDLIHGIDLLENLKFGENVSNFILIANLFTISGFIAMLYLLIKPEIREYIKLKSPIITIKTFLYIVAGLIIFDLPLLLILLIPGNEGYINNYLNTFIETFKSSNNKIVILSTGFVFLVAGPVLHEVFFRGVLYSAIKERLGFISAFILQIAIYSLVYSNMFIFTLWFAIISTLIYEKTKNLYSSIGFHFLFNLMAFSSLLIKQ